MARLVQLVFGLFFLTLVAGVIALAVAPVPVAQKEETKIISPERFQN
jgi:hypothetical protein